MNRLIKGEDLLWNDHEVKLLDQAVRTMESYVSQFPDVRVKLANRTEHVDVKEALEQMHISVNLHLIYRRK